MGIENVRLEMIAGGPPGVILLPAIVRAELGLPVIKIPSTVYIGGGGGVILGPKLALDFDFTTGLVVTA